jgi:hypothetical protein
MTLCASCLHITSVDGLLYVVNFTSKKGETLTNYVYIEKDEITVCKNPALLNSLVSQKSKKAMWSSYGGSIINGNGRDASYDQFQHGIF